MPSVRHSKSSGITASGPGRAPVPTPTSDTCFTKTPEEAADRIEHMAATPMPGLKPCPFPSATITRVPISTVTSGDNAVTETLPKARIAIAAYAVLEPDEIAGSKRGVFITAYANEPQNPKTKVSLAFLCGNNFAQSHIKSGLGEDIAVRGFINEARYPKQGEDEIRKVVQDSIVHENSGCNSHFVNRNCLETIAVAKALQEGPEGKLGEIYQISNTKTIRELTQFLVDVAKSDIKNLHEGKPLESIIDFAKNRKSASIPAMPETHVLTPQEKQIQELVKIEKDFAKRGIFSKEVIRLTSIQNFKPARVLVVGPAGVGKSNTMRTMGTDKRLFPGGYHEIQLMPDTEPKDLLGGYYPTVNQETKQKSYEYVEGPLIAAMQAAKEQRTMLNLEEIGNAPHLTRIFKGLFNPHDGKYTLSIDRPESKDGGSFGLTSVSCPVQNLVVVGSANAGDGYSLDLGDRAVRDRFVIIRYGIDRELLMRGKDGDSLANAQISEFRSDALQAIQAIFTPGDSRFHSQEFCDRVRPAVVKTYDGFVNAVRNDVIDSPLSIRAIAEAAQTTPKNDYSAFVANLKLYGKNSVRMLPDGTEMMGQVRSVEQIIDASFPR